MNVYQNQKTSEYLVSEDGCPEGWGFLGNDPEITNDNKFYVIGFEKNHALFDTAKLEENKKQIYNAEIKRQLRDIDEKSIRALRDGDKKWIDEYKEQANKLRKQLIK